MAHEQPPQMSRAHSQPVCQQLHAAIFEPAFPDQSQRARNRVGSSLPAGSSRTSLRPAAQTRPESRFRRGGRSRKVAAILLLRRWCRTNRTAIHAAPQHSDVELAIEARIARQSRPRTHLPIQHHAIALKFVNSFLIIVQAAMDSGRFRTHLEKKRQGPKTSSLSGSKSVNVQLCGNTSVTFAAVVGCYDFACPSLRGVSEVPYTVPGRIQSVPQWLLPALSSDGLAPGMDSLLRMRFTAQPQPVEVG